LTLSKQADDCAKKTANKGRFIRKEYAKKVASKYSRNCGVPMRAYRCKVCGYYHVATKTVVLDGKRQKMLKRKVQG
jgi:rubrerythrin